MSEEVCPVVIDRAGRDIHAEAARIRAQGPVARIELPGGVLGWSVTGYAQARDVLADHRFSKDATLHWPAFATDEIGPDFPLISWAAMRNLSTAYGQEHNRLRRLVSKAFTPRRVDAMRPLIDVVVAGSLDDLAATAPAGDQVDLKDQFSLPVATKVICDLIGIPGHARGTILRSAKATVDTTRAAEEVAALARQVHIEMGDLVEAREEDESALSFAELVSMLMLLLGVGTETVTNLITNATAAMLVHPDQRELVVADKVSWMDVIEESLRVDAPVAHLPFRFPVEDVEIDGVTIPAGEPVLIHYAGIGRDPVLHGAGAGQFDVRRPSKEHLSFGYGVYRCIGVPLARLEALTALTALFGRFPGLTLACPATQLEPQGSFIINGWRALPVYLGSARPS
jgi:2-hydroxy-5-methyl-1-naphthoate 7-hydroxylase